MAVERHPSYYDIDQEIEVTSPRTARSLLQYDHNHCNLSIKIVSTLLINTLKVRILLSSNTCRSSHKNSETQKIKTTALIMATYKQCIETFFLPLQINSYTHVDHVCKILAL